MTKTLIQREEELRMFFKDLRFGLTEEEIEEMEMVRDAMIERSAVPESERVAISENLQKRMQSEQDASNAIRKMTDEQRKKIDKILGGESN